MKLGLERIDAEGLEDASGYIIGAQSLLPHSEWLCVKGITYVARQNDEPFFLAGAYPLWPGVAEAWILSRTDLPPVPIFTARSLRWIVKVVFSEMKLHRLQIDFNVTEHKSTAMPIAAGFKPEGVMKSFTYDKQDRLRMAIVREECP
jgi:hypothetical protein